NSNITLRTSDNVDFYVNQMILSEASPFFASTLPRPTPNETAINPIIDVPEYSIILDPILRLCYSVKNPTITVIND
ncbi:hypothetical protein BDQ17DRAFT_1191828, partial [Cyathus striatus]